MGLITIIKSGEPKLQILAEHLEEYQRLGWQYVEDVAEAVEHEAKNIADKATAKAGNKPAAKSE